MENKIKNDVTIPFYIFARQKMTNGSIISNVSVNRFNTGSWGGVNHALLPKSLDVEL